MRSLARVGLTLMVGLGMSGCYDTAHQATAPEESSRQKRPALNEGPSTLSAGPAVGLKLVAEGLSNPVQLVEAPDGTGRLFILDQIGLVRILTPEGILLEEPFLDLRSKLVTLNPAFDERGLLGIAFHPNYASNGRFFVYYSAPLRAEAPAGYNHTSHISEFRVSADPNKADPASERIVLQVDQPQFNHNAGTLAFGPTDGYLYISLGDGGGANDTGLGHPEDWYEANGGGNGQNLSTLLGSILRINVDAGLPYGIPADNPFVGREDARAEIYAYGFRNPYRFSFDMGGSHALFAGDAGQELWEEVSIVTKGGNYGWNVKEGTHCFDAENPTQVPETCPSVDPSTGIPLTDPALEFANAKQGGLGFEVVGGHVYRGRALPQLNGRYLFGTAAAQFAPPRAEVYMGQSRPFGLWHMQKLRFTTSPNGELNHFLLGFGQDAAGEVYLLTSDSLGPTPTGESGRVYQLISPSGKGPNGR